MLQQIERNEEQMRQNRIILIQVWHEPGMGNKVVIRRGNLTTEPRFHHKVTQSSVRRIARAIQNTRCFDVVPLDIKVLGYYATRKEMS